MDEKSGSGLTASGRPSGPTSEGLSVIGDRAMTLESVRKYIGCGNVRRLYVEALGDKKAKRPTRFRVTLYDDANHRTILIDGSLRDPRRVGITESTVPPRPSDREFAEAVQIVRDDASFATTIGARQLDPYQPSPALVLNELPDGRIERHIAVGLRQTGCEAQHEIVAVDLVSRLVFRFQGGLPPVRIKKRGGSLEPRSQT
ncbi:MAG TPA: hypothetical protein VN638_00410 [Nitrospiraceae bacterium]|jgi:hypothetical protein|nr:hypothetical protein [Nitrospiraceae bacterium]